MDIQKEKKVVSSSLNAILHSLQLHFPWLVVETAISMQDRLGEDNSLVISVFEDVLDNKTKELLEQYLPECTESGAVSSDVALNLLNAYSTEGVADILSRNVFSFDTEVNKECLPWDIKETEAGTFNSFFTNTKESNEILTIKKVKMDLASLFLVRSKLLKQENDFKDEIVAINTLFEVLNYNI